MGQRVNPHSLRVEIIRDWDSRWFENKKDYSIKPKDSEATTNFSDSVTSSLD